MYMQKKHTILLVLGLGLLTALFVGARHNMQYLMPGNYMMDDFMYEEKATLQMAEPAMLDSVGMMAPEAGVAESRIAAEPYIGMMPPYYYGDDALDVVERSYEKTSSHGVVVEDVSIYLRGMKEYFSSVDGVVLSSSVNTSDKYENGYLYVKVPVDRFDEATNRVTEQVEKVMYENINATDVTGQVVRTEETLISLQEQKSLLEAQLEDAKTEVDKRRIQIQIDRLDRQIEAAEQNQDAVEARVEYASVSISAADSERYYNPDSSGDIGYEFERAWRSLKNFLKVALLFGVWIAVYSVVWLPVVWILNKVVKRFKK